jgi:peptide-methionine (S)-S-oxide reductase
MTQSAPQPAHNREVVTLAGGCFWCLEAVYQLLPGVERIVSGYMGGTLENPTYDEVCGGDTGHAEVVQLTFNPTKVSFEEILGVFFSVHDPTTLNRQGGDVGTQYRSAIFYHSDAQRETAEKMIASLEQDDIWTGVVTEVVPLTTFYEAESYHQSFYRNNPYQPYCMAVVAPKVSRFRKQYLSRLEHAG